MAEHIVLTSEQSQIIRGGAGPVEVRDLDGRIVGQLDLLSPEDIETIERAKRNRSAGGPTVPSDQVLAHLRRLGEIRAQSGLDEATMLDLLPKMRAGEPV